MRLSIPSSWATALLLSAAAVLLAASAAGQRFRPNYDEAKVPEFVLPDPLGGDGQLRNKETWERTLRPATLDLITREMYGSVPANDSATPVAFELASSVDDACDGIAIRREYTITFEHRRSPQLRMLVYLPKNARKVPAFAGLNFRGNHTLEKDDRITLQSGFVLGGKKNADNRAAAAKSRGRAARRWPAKMLVERGYALATVCCTDIDPDFDDGFENGVHAMFPKPKAHEWGTISAWAWGLSRMLDVLEQIPEIDASRVAVIGHSRLGKTSLWAAARDPRFAMAISNNSGCGGAALSKRAFGETVERINSSFPHWFNGNFKKYGGNESALPFDQHQLIALIAPRPVYVASATRDNWADPKGEFLSLLHGEAVYRLYQDTPFGVSVPPEPGKRVGDLMGYHLRQGKHDITPEDWAHYLDFADRWLKQKPVQVYILSGQSNMVGIGQVSGGSQRWSGITDASVSVYPGPYRADVDYSALEPTTTRQLAAYGGVRPTPFPGGGVQIARGKLSIKTSGVYSFRAGYAASEFNVMKIEGVEVYRRNVGGRATQTPIRIEAGKQYAFEITFFTAAANGLGWWTRTDVPGTLETIVKTDGKFSHLVDEQGRWVVRDDVWYRGLVTAGANTWLQPGCGANKHQIGPELGFGTVLGNHHDEPVLVIKTSQGNRSLGWDFLPPGSERFVHDGRTYAGYRDTPESWIEGEEKRTVQWYAGKQYDDCFQPVHELLANFDTSFPHWAGRGYEIAGFGWWQGHKDGGSAAHTERYEQNLVRLIRSLRRDFGAPHAPFLIATIGFGGWNMSDRHQRIAAAQLAVSGENGTYADFVGNVKTVETRDFWRAANVSPRNQDFHYHGNAETYYLVGEALGRGMIELRTGK